MAWAGCTSIADSSVKVWINLDQVTTLASAKSGTSVEFSNGNKIVVADKAEDILSALDPKP